jgi:putative transposase
MSTQYPAVVRLWENARSDFVAFLDYDVKIGSTVNRTAPSRCRNAGHRRRC